MSNPIYDKTKSDTEAGRDPEKGTISGDLEDDK